MSTNIDAIKKLCEDFMSDADIYIEVFRRRARPLKIELDLLRFGGLAVPIITAILYMPEVNNLRRLPGLSLVLFIVLIAVLLFSILSIVRTWDANLFYYYESIREYTELKQDFLKLLQVGHEDAGVQNHVFEIARTKFKSRLGRDINYDISNQELKQARQVIMQRNKGVA
ncbi:hypothetical protein A0257_03605 [Hymenobacter psoromatis]|nr:hypothetical protein A0257_03605 [Hymenobacter psoromatis]